MNEDPLSPKRLTAMESALTHYQRDYEQLHEVVLVQGGQIDQLQRRLKQCEAMLRTLAQQLPDTEHDPEERPPHY